MNMSQPLNIVDAIKECHQVFQNASAIPSLEHREWVENRLADFNLWYAGVNASGSGKSSLQARLTTSLEAQTFLIQLLKLLTALLKKCIELGTDHSEQYTEIQISTNILLLQPFRIQICLS